MKDESKPFSKWQKIKYWWGWNKETIYSVFVIIGVVGGFIFLLVGGIFLGENKANMERCKVMEENGNNVKIEIHKVLLSWKKCYVEIEEGRYIPYDRFGNIGYQ